MLIGIIIDLLKLILKPVEREKVLRMDLRKKSCLHHIGIPAIWASKLFGLIEMKPKAK